MFSLLSHWWRRGVRPGRGVRPPPSCRLGLRPRLEALEDRCVPSTIAVTRSNDDVTEKGTLRYAVANASSGDTILLAAALKDTPIVLTQGELLINQDVTIKGVDNVPETISGANTSRVFEIAQEAHVSLLNLTITGGNGLAANPLGSLTLDSKGGGILNLGMLTITSCTISGNTSFGLGGAFGGGIYNDFANGDTIQPVLTVTNSTISNNAAFGLAGGIGNFSGFVTLTGCTIANNYSVRGGGLFNVGQMVVSNTLIANNTADPTYQGQGGGILSLGTLTVTNCTLTGNTAYYGGAIANFEGDGTIQGCTISNNTAYKGGGIFTTLGAIFVIDCTITNNVATYEGGGIYSVEPGIVVSGATFCGNTPDAIFGACIDAGGNTFC